MPEQGHQPRAAKGSEGKEPGPGMGDNAVEEKRTWIQRVVFSTYHAVEANVSRQEVCPVWIRKTRWNRRYRLMVVSAGLRPNSD
jgi:hypothetical protein